MSKPRPDRLHGPAKSGFVPIRELPGVQSMEFPPDCLETCQRLQDLLNSRIPDKPYARSLFTDKLAKARSCPGEQQGFMGHAACGADLMKIAK